MTRQEWDAAYAAWQRGEGARPPPRNKVVVKPEPPPWRDPRWRYEPPQPTAQPATHAPPQPVAPVAHAPPVRVEPHAPKLVAVASDIHWNSEAPSWRAFRAWHRDVRPAHTILLGDLIDAACASRHPPHKDDPQSIVDEVDALVREVNALRAECERITVSIGNHDARIEAYLRGGKPHITRGLRGLTLPEIARAHGLDPSVEWFEETAERPFLEVAQFRLTHGHNGASRFGGGMHLAANSITKSNGASVLRGHSHRAQVFARTAYGRTAIGVANPCMVRPMGYAPNADWQTGFSVLLLRPPSFDHATPYVVVCDDEGGFSWGSRYYSARP